MGNISQEIIKMTSVIRGTAKGEGKFLKIQGGHYVKNRIGLYNT